MRRWVPLALVCCIVGSATPAAAQFTSAVIPPRAAVPETAAVAAHLDSARRAPSTPDSGAAATLVDMKLWVDSAAQALGARVPGTAADTDTTAAGAAVTPVPATGRGVGATRDTGAARAGAPAGKVTHFRNGAPAPETATPLPLLLLLGLGALATGALLRRR